MCELEIKKKFNAIDGETLLDMNLPRTKFVIQGILPQGLAIIAGAPKIEKSWLMLDWCVKIAKGENIWSFKSTQGTTLYLCLEDNNNRIQERLLTICLAIIICSKKAKSPIKSSFQYGAPDRN